MKWNRHSMHLDTQAATRAATDLCVQFPHNVYRVVGRSVEVLVEGQEPAQETPAILLELQRLRQQLLDALTHINDLVKHYDA